MQKSGTAQQAIAPHWIGGAWVTSARTGVSINPTTNEPVGVFADGGRPRLKPP